MPRAEGNLVFAHQDIGNLLRAGPVQIELLQSALRLHLQGIENAIELLHHADGLLRELIGAAQAPVRHAGRDIMCSKRALHGHAQERRAVGARPVKDARIALLRHSAGYIGIAVALLKQNPRTRLGILLHNLFDKAANMNSNAARDATHFQRCLLREHLPGVIGIIGNAIKAQKLRHLITIQGPAGAI